MLDFVVVAQIAHRLYDFGNTSLVVGSQQSGAVCDDDVFALMGFQLRNLLTLDMMPWLSSMSFPS